jgi:RNA polymerase sigma-70 factor (ECF subfamily)
LDLFLRSLGQGDVAALQALLAEGMRATSDGGEFVAARVPVLGRDKTLRFVLGAAKRGFPGTTIRFRMLNGLPALVIGNPRAAPGWVPRAVTAVRLDDEGRIRDLWTVLASRKLTALGS